MRATQSVTVGFEIGEPSGPIAAPLRISEEAPGSVPDGFARWKKTSVYAQKQEGFHTVFVSLEAGDITANQLRALAAICRTHSAEGLARIGFTQNIALRYVAGEALEALYSGLVGAGLARPGALTMAAPIGCSGTTSCNLALTNSHRLAKEVQRKFVELGLDEDSDLLGSSIKISGCPNSCGQHGIATVGFYGGGGRAGKTMYPVYQMSLGGRADGQTMLGVACARVPAKRVIPAILEIIEAYRSDRQGGEPFREWVHQIVSGAAGGKIRTVEDIKARLAHLTAPPAESEDADFFKDYGSEGGYHTKTGRGECAA